ncbi:DUF1501 domain-containing protein [Paraburkholderia sp. 2C]
MKRREFLSTAAAAAAAFSLPHRSSGATLAGAGNVAAGGSSVLANSVVASAARERKLLVLIELKGGNDGLNTVVPYADPLYYRLRPRVAVSRDAVLPISERAALHPALDPLMPLWQSGQLAIVQGLGYPQFNLSHFRATEIWDTASDAQRYLRDGWVARAFAQSDTGGMMRGAGLVVGSAEHGPLAGGACAVTTSMPASMGAVLGAPRMLDYAVIRITLNGFDTHFNQRERHAALLAQFAQGIDALHAARLERGLWDDTLVVSYSEFGRRPRENESGGTGHGSSAPHFVIGGRVRGGLYGAPPSLSRLDGNGNLPMAVDFRCLYATVLRSWWRCDAAAVLERRFEPLPLLRA